MRKAEVGFKGHIAPRTDFSVELDPVRPDDPFRRTYIRLAAHERLHMKCGIEKAPIGLEELGVHLESHWPRWLLQFAVTNGGRRLLLDDNANKAITARIVWAPHAGLSLGSAAMLGEAGQERRARDRYNAEFKIGSNMTGAQAEFFRARDGSVWSSAYYSSAYALLPAWNNLFGTQPAVRYEHIGRSDANRVQERRLMTLGVNLLFDEHRSTFQVNDFKDLHTGGIHDELRAQYQVEF